MGLFFSSQDPIKQHQKNIKLVNKGIQDFYKKSLFNNNRYTFNQNDIKKWIGVSDDGDPLNEVIAEVLMNETIQGHLYMSFLMFCPICNREILSGSIIPQQQTGGITYCKYSIGQVDISQADIICQYCDAKLKKENQMTIVKNSIMYHLDPKYVEWYMNNI